VVDIGLARRQRDSYRDRPGFRRVGLRLMRSSRQYENSGSTWRASRIPARWPRCRTAPRSPRATWSTGWPFPGIDISEYERRERYVTCLSVIIPTAGF